MPRIYLWQFFNIFRDIFFAYLFIRTIPENKERTDFVKTVAPLCLCAIMIMAAYNDGNVFANGYFRFVYRGFFLFLYIYLVKTIPLSTKIYDAVLIDTICSVNHNFFMSPVTLPLLKATAQIHPDAFWNEFICFIIINICAAVIYIFIYFSLPIKDIQTPNKTKWLLLISIAVGSLYLNSTLKAIGDLTPASAQQLSNYILILQFVFLLCLVFVERYHTALHKQVQTQLENQAAHALLESIETQQRSDNIIRQMRHDLKNHMVSIRHLVENENVPEAVQYINSFLQEDALNQAFIKTGNSILDGILIQKLTMAEKNNIDVSISADFSFIRNFDGADLCVLFGNLLDNAIEASIKVTEGPKYINIKGRRLNDTMIYSIENSADKVSTFRDNLPMTTKRNNIAHGIGLVSAKRIVDKNNGSIAFSSEKEKFTVVLTFPIGNIYDSKAKEETAMDKELLMQKDILL